MALLQEGRLKVEKIKIDAKMNYFKTLTILFSILLSTFSSFAQTFTITGTVEGLKDRTWIYLRNARPDKKLDSVKVTNGKFRLSGKMDEKIIRVYLHTEKYTDYISFWLEENPLNIRLKSGEFKKAIITGSKTELEDKLLSKVKARIEKQEDSLSNLLEAQKDKLLKTDLQNKLKSVRKKGKEIELDYVKSNPNSLISANLLEVYASDWDKEKISQLYQNLSSEMKNTSYGKNIKDFLTLNKEIKIGGQFADFSQANTNGKMIKLSDIKAKYILLEFWGSWCGPCREENPNLVKTHATYKNKGFEILGVAADNNKEQWLKAIKEDKLPWENVCDLKGDKNVAALIYGINAYPTNFLIDEKGIIIAKNLRGENLAKKLAELLP